MTTKKRNISGHCTKCGSFRRRLSQDHIIPKWNGGADTPDNIQLLCANCHEDKTYEEQNSPEFHVNHSAKLKKSWSDPDLVAKHSATMLERFKDPAEREKLTAAQLKRYAEDPNARLRQSRNNSTRYEDPAEREKTGAAMREALSDPDVAKKMSVFQKQRYQDPKVVETHCERQQATWDKKRAEDPEAGNKHAEKVREGKRKAAEGILSERQIREMKKTERELARIRAEIAMQDLIEAEKIKQG